MSSTARARPGTGCDVAIYAPGLSAKGGAEGTAVKAAVACDALGLAVVLLSDAPVDRGDLERHFGVDLGDVQTMTLAVRDMEWLPVAVSDAVRDVRHVRSIRRLAPRLLVNMKFRSELPGCAAKNWYYVHFPHLLRIGPRSPLHALYLRLVSGARRVLVGQRSSTFVPTYESFSANSQFTAAQTTRRWDTSSDVVYPPCGAPPLAVVAASDRDPVIISVGRFQAYDGPDVPYKSQDILVNGFRELVRVDPHSGWRLHLVGPTPTSARDIAFLNDLRAASEGLPVTFHLGVSKAELDALYGHALVYWHAQGYGTDAHLHPQAQEHFGITTVEAMAAGAIPLVYDSAGPREVVQAVSRDLTWTTTDELVTRTVAIRSPTIDVVQEGCRDRSTDFTDAAFVTRVQDKVRPLLAGPHR